MTSVIRCGHQQTVGLNPTTPYLLCPDAADEDLAQHPDAPVCDGKNCGHECHSSS